MPIDNEFVKQANADRVSEMKRLLRPLPNFGQQSAARFVVPGERPKKVRAKPQHKEHEQQCAFFELVRSHAKTRDLLIYAIPNSALATSGKKADVFRMVRAKREGLVAGMPDINVDEPVHPLYNTLHNLRDNTRLIPGLRIEMKKGDRRKDGTQKMVPTAEQLAIHRKLIERDYVVRVCYSAQEAWQVLIDYLDGKLT